MSNKTFLLIVSISIVVAGLIAFLVWLQVQANNRANQASPELIDFAKCLSGKGIEMYGTESCSWCLKQKALFKNAWQYINYVDCFKDPNKCVASGVESTPTWIFPNDNNKKIVGYRELSVLSQESGCPLNLQND